MSFLSPWFLLGAALIVGPIIAHLIRQATRKRVAFSATRFLSASPPKLDRRNRIQHPWLLLLRCLVVGLLAMGFARPYFKRNLPVLNTPTIPQSVVAVLDESASMQRAGLWDAARKKIYDLADSLGPNDQFAILGVSGGVEHILSHEQWKETAVGSRDALVRGALADRKPGWGPKNLDAAIEQASAEWEQMSENVNAVTRKKIVVVSDFTASGRVSGLAGLDWPKGSEVKLEPVTPTHAGDAGLQWLGWSDSDAGLTLRARIVQSAKSTATALSVQLRDAATNQPIGAPQKLTVQAGDSQIVEVPVPADDAKKPLRLDLSGDEENFDNTLWAVHPSPREITLTYYGGHAANDIKHARFYLERAVAGWKDPLVHVVAGETASAADTSKPGSEFFVIAGPLDAAAAANVRNKVAAGDFALVLLNDPKMVDTAAALAGETDWAPIQPAQKNAMFGQIDFQHPLFSLFSDPHYSDFTHIQFTQAQSVKLPPKSATVVAARFDDGSPAVLETTVGKGRMIVWGSDWSTAVGNWVLSTKFIPWLESLVERAAGGAQHPVIAEVGDTDRLLGGEPAQWRPLSAVEGSFQETTPTLPGVYQMQQGDTTHWVALQVPATASNIAPMPLETWEKLGVPLHAQPVTTASPIAAPLGEDQTAPKLEARQKLWRWLLLGAALILALESIYSLALARRPEHNPPEAAA
jgi:hypothetical protein